MANRAYLYSDDRPDAWEPHDERYYDSRWTIPLAWFFLFKPEDIRMVDWPLEDPAWQEVKFSAQKSEAIALFATRKALLMSLMERRIGWDKVEEFVSNLGLWPGRFLFMDPDEVLGGGGFGSDDNPEHAERFARILKLIGSDEAPPDAVREATRLYVGGFNPDPDISEGQIIGYTYWWPSEPIQ